MKNIEYTSDRVNIVRCKDCRYSEIFTDTTTAKTPLKCRDIRYGGVFPEWYCEHGERKNKDEIN